MLPFLGHVSDHDDGHTRLLGNVRHLRRAFAHLRDRTGRGRQRFGIDGLDRVDDGNFGPLFVDSHLNLFELDLGEQAEIGNRAVLVADEPEPLRAQRDLRAGLLAAHIQCAPLAGDCSKSVNLPMPGSPPGNSPPPSTRSNSPTLVVKRGTSAASISASRCTGELFASA